MGSITLPATGRIYFDSNIIIYSVEKHPKYSSLLRDLWGAIDLGRVIAVVSEFALVEVLVGAYRIQDEKLANDYERLFQHSGIEVVAVTSNILREAARLRAINRSLRPPDAIHVASALTRSITSFLTNDIALRHAPGLNVTVLDDLLSSTF